MPGRADGTRGKGKGVVNAATAPSALSSTQDNTVRVADVLHRLAVQGTVQPVGGDRAAGGVDDTEIGRKPGGDRAAGGGNDTAIGRRELNMFLQNTNTWLASEIKNISICFLALDDVERAVSYPERRV